MNGCIILITSSFSHATGNMRVTHVQNTKPSWHRTKHIVGVYVAQRFAQLQVHLLCNNRTLIILNVKMFIIITATFTDSTSMDMALSAPPTLIVIIFIIASTTTNSSSIVVALRTSNTLLTRCLLQQCHTFSTGHTSLKDQWQSRLS
jgi:hypothetical protein